MAFMEREEIAEKFARDINGVVEDWFWSKEDAITEIQNITEVEDDLEEISIQFWKMVTDEGDFLDKTDYFEGENSWMEPGVAYTMGEDGWESWEDPRQNY